MSYKVVYFTRSGCSKKVAEKIGEKVSCEVIGITDDKNWSGIIGYMKAGFYSVRNKPVTIQLSGKVDEAEELIIVAPLWAGGTPPAVNAFLAGRALDKIHLVMTSKGSTLKNRDGYKSVSDIVERNKDEDAVIDALVGKLG